MLYRRRGENDIDAAPRRLLDAKRAFKTKFNGYSYYNYQNGGVGGRAGKCFADKKFYVDIFACFSVHDKKGNQNQRDRVFVPRIKRMFADPLSFFLLQIVCL